jgi:hypothetical protein
MQRNDYKNALNELQLSSKFCEKMEKKLTAEKQAEADEYEDVVTHVDVIKPRRFRGLATAAAVVVAAGALGGGAYYRYGERSDVEPHGEHMIYDDYDCNFPFGVIPLHDVIFNVSDRAINSSIVAYDKIAKNLDDFFEHTEWTELTINDNFNRNSISAGISFISRDYYVNVLSDETVYVTKNLKYDSSVDDDNYSYDYDYDYVIINGRMVKNDTSSKYEYYKYSLPEGSYAKLMSILLEDRVDSNADFCGVKGSFINADYSISNVEGKVSEVQAYSLSHLFNTATWLDDTEGLKPDSEENRITLGILNNNEHYAIALYKNGLICIIKNTEGSDTEEVSKFRLKNASIYNDIKNTLTACDQVHQIIDCPVNLQSDYAVVIRNKDGAQKAYVINEPEYDSLADAIAACEWTRLDTVYRSILQEDGTTRYEVDEEKVAQNENTFTIILDNDYLVVYDNDQVYLHPGGICNISETNHLALDTLTKDLDENLSDDEFADFLISYILRPADNHSYFSLTYYNIGGQPKTRDTNDPYEISDWLRELEWTMQENCELNGFEKEWVAFYSGFEYIPAYIDREGNMKIRIGEKEYYFNTDNENFSELFDKIVNYK